MATFAMQAMGCEVAALNTVHFSNHAGYRQLKGTRTSAQEIGDIYEGLCQSYLTDFDVLLSGYAPSAAAVEAVGKIAMDIQQKAESKPGSFFWVLDPVMGDRGRIYVNEDVVPAYKNVLQHADLILPNQFETELLSGVKITSLSILAEAITILHKTYKVPHIIVTSVQLPSETPNSSDTLSLSLNTLSIIGSTTRSDGSPRLFKVDVPALDCFFSGTGDMFAALTVARLREAVFADDSPTPVRNVKSWISSDDVEATELPLAKATVKVLASMHDVLERTMAARIRELEGSSSLSNSLDGANSNNLPDAEKQKLDHLRETKAAEIRLVRNVGLLKNPITKFVARPWSV
ncbi:putative pyridoxal kinase [Arachnomyces sp. PD_36]|nr:putative pyridoxal kinase [Arachnomyces sp. PD_36]